VVPALAESYRVLVYDRRGHSRSDAPAVQGSLDEDADDLAALVELLGLAPVHVVANSVGGIIALRLVGRRPDLFRSLSCHEPPLWALLENDTASRGTLERTTASVDSVGERIADGDREGAARQFVEEVTAGPGAWELLPAQLKETMVSNAETFLDELRDPTQARVDERMLAQIPLTVRLTQGAESPPVFGRVIDRLEQLIPHVVRVTFPGAAHVPHATVPDDFVEFAKQALGDSSRS
jgi:pimeloyl-ACP methyl ester carboxylesterase